MIMNWVYFLVLYLSRKTVFLCLLLCNVGKKLNIIYFYAHRRAWLTIIC